MIDVSVEVKILSDMEEVTKSDLLWSVGKASPGWIENVNIIDLKGDMWLLHKTVWVPQLTTNYKTETEKGLLMTTV